MEMAAESRFCMLQETISLNKNACFLDRNEKSCFFLKWHRAVIGASNPILQLCGDAADH